MDKVCSDKLFLRPGQRCVSTVKHRKESFAFMSNVSIALAKMNRAKQNTSPCPSVHTYTVYICCTYLPLPTLHQTLFSRLAVSCRCSWKITWKRKKKKRSLIEVRERICRINSMTKTRFDLAAWKTFTRLGPTAGGQMKFRLRFTCPPACRRLKRGAPLLRLHHLFHRGSGIWPEKLKTWQKEQISLRGHERHCDVTFFFFFLLRQQP